MAQALKLCVSLPFRSEGDPAYFGDCVFGASSATKGSYYAALEKEIRSFASEDEELVVDEIAFGPGPMGSVNTDVLVPIMRAIRQSFTVTDDALIYGSAVPGGVSVDFLGFLKNNHASWIELEALSSNYYSLKGIGLPPTKSYMQVTCYVLESFGGFPIGVLLDGRIDGTYRVFRDSLIEACNYGGAYIRFSNLTSENAAAASEYLPTRGYESVRPGLFARGDWAKFPRAHAEQIGVGRGALTTLNGITFQTTTNLARYAAHSDRFDLIAQPVTQ